MAKKKETSTDLVDTRVQEVIEPANEVLDAEIIEHQRIIETTAKRSCRYNFTDAERADHGVMLSKQLTQKQTIAAELSSLTKQYKADIESVDNEIIRVKSIVDCGYEDRMIDCRVQFHYPESNQKTYTRTDNGDTWTEPMESSDYRQLTLLDVQGVKVEEEDIEDEMMDEGYNNSFENGFM